MSGEKVNKFDIADINLSKLMQTVDVSRYGYYALSISEMGTNIQPVIKAGSIIEVGGALYEFEVDEIINCPAEVTDGQVYIKLIPDGMSISAEFTNDHPSFCPVKNGWYEPLEIERFLPVIMTKSGTNYLNKQYVMFPDQNARFYNLVWGKAIAIRSVSPFIFNLDWTDIPDLTVSIDYCRRKDRIKAFFYISDVQYTNIARIYPQTNLIYISGESGFTPDRRTVYGLSEFEVVNDGKVELKTQGKIGTCRAGFLIAWLDK